jgi:hypothetical protein
MIESPMRHPELLYDHACSLRWHAGMERTWSVTIEIGGGCLRLAGGRHLLVWPHLIAL